MCMCMCMNKYMYMYILKKMCISTYCARAQQSHGALAVLLAQTSMSERAV